MKELKEHLNKIINSKIKFLVDKNEKIEGVSFFNKDELIVTILSLVGSGLLIKSGLIYSDPQLFILSGMVSALLGLNIFYIYKSKKTKDKIIKTLKSGTFDISEMNYIYEKIISKISFSKEDIECFFNKVRKIGLSEEEINHCVKKTMKQTELDLGNGFFFFLLYNNLEDFYTVKNDPHLEKKLKFQKINETIKEEEIHKIIKENKYKFAER